MKRPYRKQSGQNRIKKSHTLLKKDIKNRRKSNARKRQAEALKERARAETLFFWTRRKSAATILGGRRQKEDYSEQMCNKIFGKTLSVGINFDQYDEIKVETQGIPRGSHSPLMESFDIIKNPPWLSKNVQRMHYVKTTPIQRYAIPLALSGFDIMCCAQTGSGKTAAFLTPIVCSFKDFDPCCRTIVVSRPTEPTALILAPTRELALQIDAEAQKLCFGSGIRSCCIYGGAKARPQLEYLAFGTDILVATPGRLIDFLDRKILSLKQCEFLVLDEADRMLDMGFIPQIREIVQKRDMRQCQNRSTFMFSATFAPQIKKLASDFMREYVWIGVGRIGSTVNSITQRLVQLHQGGKSERLRLCINAVNEIQGRTLIFVQRKRTARWLSTQLSKLSGDVIEGVLQPITFTVLKLD